MSLHIFSMMLQASGWTISLSAISILLGLILSTVISAAMLANNRVVSFAGRAFVSFFRGAPLLVQLLLIYNLLPVLGLNVPSVVAAVIGLTLCTAAYQAENLRGGFMSVPKGLLEAAEMLGMTHFQQFWRIRAPIALRATLPALANEAILILKASSLVSVVGVVELSRMAQDLSSSTFQPLPLFATAGFLYLVINSCVALGAQKLERSFRWGIKV
jgi:polar amino acid transport system permease protein